MRNLFKITGLILQKKSLLKNDYLITVFTKEFGKISVFAKGIKKITSRRLSHLETGNLIRAIISQKNNYFYLNETNLISGFSSIKKHQKKGRSLYYILYLISALLPEEQKNRSLYQLLIKNLILLNKLKKEKIEEFKKNFTKDMLIDLGYLNNNHHNADKVYRKVEEIMNKKIPSYII